MEPTPEMIEEAINIKKDGRGPEWSKKIGTLMKVGLIAYEPYKEYFFVVPKKDRIPVKEADVPGLYEWYAREYHELKEYKTDLVLLYCNLEDLDIQDLFELIEERDYTRSFLNMQAYASYIFGDMMEKGEIVWTGKKNGWVRTELFTEPMATK